MELIEIRNNLIKLSYKEDERPTLGQFIALTGEDKSYVAQYVNLKADNLNNFAVAKLMFSFTSDGIVNDYDGSAPSIKSNIVQLPANELLDLLPVETPVKIGQITGTNEIFSIDISLFEHNFTVFCENDVDKATLISNCVRQLFRLKEKSVIIDNDGIFDEYPKITLGEDFKLPLNSDLIDFIFDYELGSVDAPTKAVIQDIFYAVQKYIKTLDDEFLPIESFIDVVTAQYKETQMPELALLKNKLLKYKDANIFADRAEEFKVLDNKLKERNCIVVNVKNISGGLQKEVIKYIHKIIETFDKYVYYFVPLTDDNSDKKMLKRLLNHNHVFTTLFASHRYKYAAELKAHAQEIMLFAPQTMQNDFAAYNTFLNKLNLSEGIIFGKLTQGIPLIISMDDLDLDLTKEDVFGDRQRFVPAIEEDILNSDDIYAINNLQESPIFQENKQELVTSSPIEVQSVVNPVILQTDEAGEEDNYANVSDENVADFGTDFSATEDIADTAEGGHIENILSDYDDDEDVATESESITESDENTQVPQEFETETDQTEAEDDLSFMDEFNDDEQTEASEVYTDIEISQNNADSDQLTEDDLDFIENNQQAESIGQEISDEDFDEIENTPIVPVYETDEGEVNNAEDIGYKAGDQVSHPRYGNGIVEKIIKYGNKTLCSIDFENVGRRLLDPSVSEFEKI